MKHRFLSQCYDPEKLFSVRIGSELTDFIKNLKKQSEEHPDRWDPATYQGDGFESLVEAILVKWDGHKRLDMTAYEPTEPEAIGVDGVGKCLMGGNHTVQAKMRMRDWVLTEGKDHIGMAPASSFTRYKAKKLTIWTTGQAVHRNLLAEWNYNQELTKVMNQDDIEKLVNYNPPFWKWYKSEVEAKCLSGQTS
jgi:hypothetical protein